MRSIPPRNETSSPPRIVLVLHLAHHPHNAEGSWSCVPRENRKLINRLPKQGATGDGFLFSIGKDACEVDRRSAGGELGHLHAGKGPRPLQPMLGGEPAPINRVSCPVRRSGNSERRSCADSLRMSGFGASGNRGSGTVRAIAPLVARWGRRPRTEGLTPSKSQPSQRQNRYPASAIHPQQRRGTRFVFTALLRILPTTIPMALSYSCSSKIRRWSSSSASA